MSDGETQDLMQPTNGLFIEDHVPETWLKLAWQGRPPRGWLRWATTTAMAIAVGVWINVLLVAIDLFFANVPQRGDAEILAVMTVIGLFMLFGAASLAGSLTGYWYEFLWDATDETFVAHQRGWFVWGRQTITIPFSSIRWLSIDLGPDGVLPLSTKLDISAATPLPFHADLTSLGLLQRDEGQEFFFDIARLVGAKGYRIHENTARQLSLQAWMKRQDYEGPDDDEDDDDTGESDFLPIPPRGASSAVKAPSKPKCEDLVRCKLPLDLPKVMNSLEVVRINEWKPGQRISILRPSAPWFVYAIVIGVVVVPAALFGRWFVFGFVQGIFDLDETARPVVMGFVALTAGCFVAFLMRNNLKERELIFDWPRQRLILRYGPTVREWPLAAVQELILSEKQHVAASQTDHEDAPRRIDGYGSRLDIVLPVDDLKVIETEKWEPKADVAGQILAPLGAELAAALQVKYSRGPRPGSDSKDLADALRMTRPQLVTLAIIGLVAVSLLASVFVQKERIRQHVAELKALGLDITFLGSYGYDHHTVCENFVSLRLTDNELLTAHGEQIRALLLTLPKVGLDLRESTLTDADLEIFRGVKLCVANISQTAITDAGLAILIENDDLVFLDADRSAISDASILALKRLPHLRFLFFQGTRITNEGAGQLHNKSSLILVRP